MQVRRVDIGIASYEGVHRPGFFATVAGTDLTGVQAVVHLPGDGYRTLSFYDDGLLLFYDNGDLSAYKPGRYEVGVAEGKHTQTFSAELLPEMRASRVSARFSPSGDALGFSLEREPESRVAQEPQVQVYARPLNQAANLRLRNRPAASLALPQDAPPSRFQGLPQGKYEVAALTRYSNVNGVMAASRDFVQEPAIVAQEAGVEVETIDQWVVGDGFYVAALGCCSTTSTCCCSTTSTQSVGEFSAEP
jgi:hypothetical protein